MAFSRERFSAIGHTGIAFWNPISPTVIDDWIRELPLSDSSRVLDVGCGRAEFLLRVVERFACAAIGVDMSESSIRAAAGEAERRGVGARVDLRCEPFDAGSFAVEAMDLAVCIGSTHAISNLEQTLRVLGALVEPRGLLLVGEGYWRREPDAEYLAFLSSGPDDLRTHAGNIDLARELSLDVVRSHEATAEEWSAYEDTYADNITAFVDTHPDDPDAAAMTERIRAWRDAYIKWGRDTLGFATYLLRTPVRGSGSTHVFPPRHPPTGER